MSWFKRTQLPLWYIVGILVLVLGSVFLFLGTKHALQTADVALATKLVEFDWLMLGTWFVVNIGMLIWLVMQKAPRSDFLYPIYYIALHGIFACMIIAGEVFGKYPPSSLVFILGTVSSLVEIYFVYYLFGCYQKTANELCKENLANETRQVIVARAANVNRSKRSPKKSTTKRKTPAKQRSSKKSASSRKKK